MKLEENNMERVSNRLNEKSYINKNGAKAKCWIYVSRERAIGGFGQRVERRPEDEPAVYVRTKAGKYGRINFVRFNNLDDAKEYQKNLLKKAKKNHTGMDKTTYLGKPRARYSS